MRRSLSLLTLLLVFLSGLLPVLYAQSSSRLQGCEANPEVRKVIDRELDPELLDRMTFADRLALERKTLEGLISKYPREFEPYDRLRNLLHQYAPEEYPSLRDRWVAMGKEHPDDPLAVLLASMALNGTDTAESIRLLEAARAKAPEFPWSARDLASFYSDGKLADPAKAKENIDVFFAICPVSSDQIAQWLLSKDPPLGMKVAAAQATALRAELEKETDPKQLKDYSTLWTNEFRTRRPQEYDAERERIAEDLKRMEKINPKGDAAWQALLIGGYKQSGAPREKITAIEDKLVAEYPHSNQAYTIVSDRWDKAHPEPQDQKDTAAWDKHRHEYEEALQGWIREYPDNTYLQRRAWFAAVSDDDTVSEKESVAAVDAFVRAIDTYDGPSWQWAFYPSAAQLLVKRGWQPDRAIDLLKQAKANYERDWARSGKNDNRSDDQMKRGRDWQAEQTQYLNGLMLKAAVQAGKPEIAAELRATVEAPPPEEKKLFERYWTNRARLALLSGNKIDALAYYQMALQTRLEAPKPYEGKVRDDLGDEAHALWRQQGGTETAWVAWSRMSAPYPTVLADGRWEKPKKSIPAFELTDLSGKTWRLKELNGKAVLIDVWATWCGPCQAELPQLQKLYDQVKNRNDIQILTFDYDENPGVVGPFLKEKGYTFPVLPVVNAAEIGEVVNDNGIPQTWVMDRSGASVWRQLGYGTESYDDFAKEMLTRLGATATN
jgi:thiol-disulfide isomerase/thioredoxin